MNHLFNLTKKELRELLTPGALISVIVMVIMFMAIGGVIGGETSRMDAPAKVGVVDADGGYWSGFAVDSMYDFYVYQYDITDEEAKEFIVMLSSPYGDYDAINKEMADNGLSTVFFIPADFSDKIDSKQQVAIEQYYVFKNEGIFGATSTLMSSVLVPWISGSVAYELISDITDPSTPAEFLLNPVIPSQPQTYINGQIHVGVTPTDISTTIMSQTMMIPIVIMMIIMVIGSMVISSMGSEKENKTLETLLTMPMKRTTIVSGKLLAAALVGLIYGMAYMVGMSFYVGGVMGSVGGLNLADYGLSLGIVDWAIIAVMIFLAIFCALGLCMILGAFTKNYKSAQTMILPITVLAMVPMFITMFSSWGSLPPIAQAIVFAIPFSHPMMVMNNLMFNDMTIVFAGMAYLAVFALIMIFITVRLYKSDILLTGLGQTKAAKAAKSLVRKGKRA